jgi:hypothetical protein
MAEFVGANMYVETGGLLISNMYVETGGLLISKPHFYD